MRDGEFERKVRVCVFLGGGETAEFLFPSVAMDVDIYISLFLESYASSISFP